MATSEPETTSAAASRLDFAFEVYGRLLAVLMMVLGLFQWAVILGLANGPGGVTFETMTMPWQVATAHFAVVDLVASVGLWQRTAWGNVVWLYAAVAEVAVHTIFVATFGSDYLIVLIYLVTIILFFALLFMRRQASPEAR